jgi:tRNA dimethylallyltransferase
MQKIVVITGPTASGKTGYSIEYAGNVGGEIINCDSAQTYSDLKILTAMPTADEMSGIPHRLFGFLECDQKITSVDWASAASREISEIMLLRKTPIVVGGTGLYINILINGISPVPDVSSETRAYSSHMAENDYDGLCAAVYENDPSIMNVIHKSQHRQMIRAFETMIETGKSILHFYELPKVRFIDSDISFEIIVVEMERQKLYKKINKRLDIMIEHGVIDEVKVLLQKVNDKHLDIQKLPISQAIGIKEIASYISGSYNLEQMKELVSMKSRNYAKRQITWFRHQLPKHRKVSIRHIELLICITTAVAATVI